MQPASPGERLPSSQPNKRRCVSAGCKSSLSCMGRKEEQYCRTWPDNARSAAAEPQAQPGCQPVSLLHPKHGRHGTSAGAANRRMLRKNTSSHRAVAAQPCSPSAHDDGWHALRKNAQVTRLARDAASHCDCSQAHSAPPHNHSRQSSQQAPADPGIPPPHSQRLHHRHTHGQAGI